MSKKDRQTESITVEDDAGQTLTLEATATVAETVDADPVQDPTPPAPPEVSPEVETPAAEEPATSSPYKVGDVVTTSLGNVKVLAVNGDQIDVKVLRTGTCKSIKVG